MDYLCEIHQSTKWLVIPLKNMRWMLYKEGLPQNSCCVLSRASAPVQPPLLLWRASHFLPFHTAYYLHRDHWSPLETHGKKPTMQQSIFSVANTKSQGILCSEAMSSLPKKVGFYCGIINMYVKS